MHNLIIMGHSTLAQLSLCPLPHLSSTHTVAHPEREVYHHSPDIDIKAASHPPRFFPFLSNHENTTSIFSSLWLCLWTLSQVRAWAINWSELYSWVNKARRKGEKGKCVSYHRVWKTDLAHKGKKQNRKQVSTYKLNFFTLKLFR